MDYGVLGLVLVVVVVAVAFVAMRPRAAQPLDPLLSALASIDRSAGLTAVQKRHEAQTAYRSYEKRTVSIIGAINEVFPNGSVVMKTSSPDLPLVGIELQRIDDEQLRALEKGRTVTLRAKLPAWREFSAIAELPAGFRDGKFYYGGHWYGVKATYRVAGHGPRTN